MPYNRQIPDAPIADNEYMAVDDASAYTSKITMASAKASEQTALTTGRYC